MAITKKEMYLTLYYHGYSAKEIAELLDNKVANVYSLIIRGRDKNKVIPDSKQELSAKHQLLLDEFMAQEGITKPEPKRKQKAKKQKKVVDTPKTNRSKKPLSDARVKNKKETKGKVDEAKPVVKQEEAKPVVNKEEAKPVVSKEEVKPVVKQEEDNILHTRGKPKRSIFSDDVKFDMDDVINSDGDDEAVTVDDTVGLKASQRVKQNYFTKQVELARSNYERGQVCSFCQAKGWVVEPSINGPKKIKCPVCLGASRKINAYTRDEAQVEVLERLIPNKKYRTTHFDHRKFSEEIDFPDVYRGRSFAQFQEFIDSVLVGLSEGNLPNKSYYIVAPDGFGKKWFAYEIIKLLVTNGFRSSGLLDVLDLHEAIDNRNAAKLREFMDTDIIMLNLTNVRAGYYTHVFQYLTEEADSKGIPVFVFSRVTAYQLIQGDHALSGLIRGQTSEYDYGELQEVGILGREYTLAEKHRKSTANQSIGYSEEEQKADYEEYIKRKKRRN